MFLEQYLILVFWFHSCWSFLIVRWCSNNDVLVLLSFMCVTYQRSNKVPNQSSEQTLGPTEVCQSVLAVLIHSAGSLLCRRVYVCACVNVWNSGHDKPQQDKSRLEQWCHRFPQIFWEVGEVRPEWSWGPRYASAIRIPSVVITWLR